MNSSSFLSYIIADEYGWISHEAAYNRILTKSEIQALYSEGGFSRHPGRVAIPFDAKEFQGPSTVSVHSRPSGKYFL